MTHNSNILQLLLNNCASCSFFVSLAADKPRRWDHLRVSGMCQCSQSEEDTLGWGRVRGDETWEKGWEMRGGDNRGERSPPQRQLHLNLGKFRLRFNSPCPRGPAEPSPAAGPSGSKEATLAATAVNQQRRMHSVISNTPQPYAAPGKPEDKGVLL